MFMSVVYNSVAQVDDVIVAASWQRTDDKGADAPFGAGVLGQSDGDLGFIVTRTALKGNGVLGCKALALPTTGWALRLDEVAFPVGAVAHRHTHSGSGWRFLVAGSLRIEAEHEITVMGQGDSWFEPAHSPVRAVALRDAAVTRFVRCMAIPLADVGLSTFQLSAPEDADLPRLQMTHRHFDHVVQDDAG